MAARCPARARSTTTTSRSTSRSRYGILDHQDDAVAQRHSRATGPVHDHARVVCQALSAQGVQVVDRYAGGLPLHQGIRASSMVCPTEPTVTGLVAHVEQLELRRRRQSHDQTVARSRRRRWRRRVHSTARRSCNETGQAMSGEATATVRVVPDQTFDCTDVFRQGLRRRESQRRARTKARKAWPACVW